MRYWTKLFDDLLTEFCEKEGKLHSLGFRAGQHLISLDLASSQIKLHGEYGRERLNNPLTKLVHPVLSLAHLGGRCDYRPTISIDS